MTKKSPLFIDCKKNRLLHPTTSRCNKYLTVEKIDNKLYPKCVNGYKRNQITKECDQNNIKTTRKSPIKTKNTLYTWVGVGVGVGVGIGVGVGVGVGIGLKK